MTTQHDMDVVIFALETLMDHEDECLKNKYGTSIKCTCCRDNAIATAKAIRERMGARSVWRIVYEDAAIPDETIDGSRESAMLVLANRRISWNCHLFRMVDECVTYGEMAPTPSKTEEPS